MKKIFIIGVLILLTLHFSEGCFAIQVKGVNYKVGSCGRFVSHREFLRDLHLIKSLNCNAVRLYSDSNLLEYVTIALEEGFDVWASPRYIDDDLAQTIILLKQFAIGLERIRRRYPNKVTLIVANELTIDMRGLIKGNGYEDRVRNLLLTFGYDDELNEALKSIVAAVRSRFRGRLVYASAWYEDADHSLLDFVGVNYYSILGYGPNLKRLKRRYNKEVVITEFGTCCYKYASFVSPICWYLPRTFLEPVLIDNETEQVAYYKKCFGTFKKAEVHGTFIYTFNEKWRTRKLYEVVSHKNLCDLIRKVYQK